MHENQRPSTAVACLDKITDLHLDIHTDRKKISYMCVCNILIKLTNLQWLSICTLLYHWCKIWLVLYFLDLGPWLDYRGWFGCIFQGHFRSKWQDPKRTVEIYTVTCLNLNCMRNIEYGRIIVRISMNWHWLYRISWLRRKDEFISWKKISLYP